MLLFRIVLLFCAHWVVNGDLLDLYVEHMDETMRTQEYKRRHPKDLKNRSRHKRMAIESRFLRIGNYRKQRLDVDENWIRQRKGKGKNQRKPLKNDGLEFPNRQEMNPEQDQHEFLNNVETEMGHKKENLSRINKKDPLEIVSVNPEFSRWIIPQIVSSSSKDREEIDEKAQFEIIRPYDSPKIARPDENPPLKKTPNFPNRIPKKYYPVPKYLKNSPKNVDNPFPEESLRLRRSVENFEFSRSEILDENGDVVLEWDPSDKENVTFKVTAKTLGYIGIGFNEKSHMKGADLILAWVEDHTQRVNLLVRFFLIFNNKILPKSRPWDQTILFRKFLVRRIRPQNCSIASGFREILT